ncbi:hypothetical protein V6N13_143331 [Hibiscus sabdariffa]
MGMLKEVGLCAVMLAVVVATSVAAQAKPGCHSSCGNISIPYPFGTGTDCNISSNFFILCNTTFNPPKAFLTTSDIEVVHISLDGYLRINLSIGYDCYNSSGRSLYFDMWLELAKFPISHTRNKFTAIGCDTYAYVQDKEGDTYSTGCLTFCNKIADVINGSCSGIGFCQTAIPKGVKSYHVTFASSNSHSRILGFNPCSYGFVLEDGAYNFSVSDLHSDDFRDKEFPMILDWTIGSQTCTEAKMDLQNYACKQHSACIDAENGPGYLCKCLDGFEGNPYLSNGCQDIDECETLKPCNGTGTCHNAPGSYSCSCPQGFEGDGWKNGTGCSLKAKPPRESFPILIVSLAIGVSLLSSLLCSSWVYLGLKQRKLTKLKQENFQQNGGILLREQLSKREGYGETAKIFTAEELKKATNNYHESRILGQGGQGTVYKGLLPGDVSVAIKKSNIGDQSQEWNPLARAAVLSWEARLKIATEAAEALSYLHSSASPPIIHRDVKLANILLDEKYSAKVSDFGLEAISFERPQSERNLALYFVSVMREQGLVEILDGRVLNDNNIEQLKEVAAIARTCVRLKGEERPSMKEVASGLQGLRSVDKHSWGKGNLHEEETKHLLDAYDSGIGYDASTTISMGPDSMKNQVSFQIYGAR